VVRVAFANQPTRQVLTFGLAFAPSDKTELVWVWKTVWVVVDSFLVIMLPVLPAIASSVAKDKILRDLPFSTVNAVDVVAREIAHGTTILLGLICTIESLLLRLLVHAQAVEVEVEAVEVEAVAAPIMPSICAEQ